VPCCSLLLHYSGFVSSWPSAQAPCLTAVLRAGDLDREKLGKIVFSDPAARKRLNAATHLPVFLDVFKGILWCWLTCKFVVVSSTGKRMMSSASSWCNAGLGAPLLMYNMAMLLHAMLCTIRTRAAITAMHPSVPALWST
jgi:hypothetical protein